MPEGPNLGRPLAQTPDDVRGLHQMCREGRLYDVERWIADGKPLQLAPETIRRSTRPKTALQIALEGGQHSLAFLLLRSGYRLEPLLPWAGLLSLIRMTGTYSLFFGILFIMLGFRLHSLAQARPAPRPPRR